MIACIILPMSSMTEEKEETIEVVYKEKENKYESVADMYRILEDSVLMPIQYYVWEITGDTTFNIYDCVTSSCRHYDHNSDHSFKAGRCAVDVDMHLTNLPISNLHIFNFILLYRNFDQLITHKDVNNPNYLHIGFRPNKNRKQVKLEYVYKGKLNYKDI